MAGAVGTEGSIADAARVLNCVAVLAGWVEGIAVHPDPVGIQVRLGFRSPADLDISDKIVCIRNYGD